MSKGGLLLDTCAVIYSALGIEIKEGARQAMNDAATDAAVHVSLISAWEISMSMAKGRIASPLKALDFFNRFVDETGVKARNLTAEILADAAILPGNIHGDPMDRMIVATAREHDLTIVTRDRAILAYGEAGYVKTLEC